MTEILKQLEFQDEFIAQVENVVNDPDLFFDDMNEFLRCAVRTYYNKICFLRGKRKTIF